MKIRKKKKERDVPISRTSAKRMKLTTRARYALRSMIQIGRLCKEGEPVSLATVSKLTSISRRYLEQLAISLKNAQLIKGVSGKGGGYVLAKPAEDIKIGEIIEAAIGPINIVDCVKQPESCLITDICECRVIYTLINDRITEVLNEFSLADLVDIKKLSKLSEKKIGKAVNMEVDLSQELSRRIRARGISPCATK